MWGRVFLRLWLVFTDATTKLNPTLHPDRFSLPVLPRFSDDRGWRCRRLSIQNAPPETAIYMSENHLRVRERERTWALTRSEGDSLEGSLKLSLGGFFKLPFRSLSTSILPRFSVDLETGGFHFRSSMTWSFYIFLFVVRSLYLFLGEKEGLSRAAHWWSSTEESVIYDDCNLSTIDAGGISESLAHGMADLVSYGNADRDIEQVRASLDLSLHFSTIYYEIDRSCYLCPFYLRMHLCEERIPPKRVRLRGFSLQPNVLLFNVTHFP